MSYNKGDLVVVKFPFLLHKGLKTKQQDLETIKHIEMLKQVQHDKVVLGRPATPKKEKVR
jgi:hypothetical protein